MKKIVLFSGIALLSCSAAFAYEAPLVSRNTSYASAPVMAQPFSEQATSGQQAYVSGDAMPAPAARAEQSTPPNHQLDLLKRMEAMSDEIRNLRGQIEEQAHTIQQIQSTQRQLYQDVDQRLSGLYKQSQTQPYAMPNNPASQAATPEGNASLQEQQAYKAAYSLLRQKQYADAMTGFQHYLKIYPEGRYAVNAHYWLGELSLITGNANQAKAEFQTVVKDYPISAKVPDALLKLGFIDADQGNWSAAHKTLDSVIKTYPNSSAATLAKQRLDQLAMQGH